MPESTCSEVRGILNVKKAILDVVPCSFQVGEIISYDNTRYACRDIFSYFRRK